MSKAVLISIKPKWCELIASGKKTVEVRKTKPKEILPVKCYIYCTKPSFPHEDFLVFDAGTNKVKAFYGGGKVIGEFVCHNIMRFDVPFPAYLDQVDKAALDAACLTYWEAHDYLGHRTGWAWHISDPVIYDTPKELSKFNKWFDDGDDIRPCQNGKKCKHIIYDYSEDCEACAIDFDGTDCPFLKVNRPPQSWRYVEEL